MMRKRHKEKWKGDILLYAIIVCRPRFRYVVVFFLFRAEAISAVYIIRSMMVTCMKRSHGVIWAAEEAGHTSIHQVRLGSVIVLLAVTISTNASRRPWP